MNELQKLIEEKVKEVALKHADIIEGEMQKAIDKFNCRPEDIILEYHNNAKIKIRLKVIEFEINNHFYWDKK